MATRVYDGISAAARRASRRTRTRARARRFFCAPCRRRSCVPPGTHARSRAIGCDHAGKASRRAREGELPFLDRWCLLMREILSQIAPRASPARAAALTCVVRTTRLNLWSLPIVIDHQRRQGNQARPVNQRPRFEFDGLRPMCTPPPRRCGRAHLPRKTGHYRRCARVIEAIEVNYARPQTRSESSTSTLSAPARRRKLRRPLPPGAVATGDSRGGGCERPGTPQAALPLPRRHIPHQNTRLRAGMVEGWRAPQRTECSLTSLFLIAARRRGVCSGRGGRG